MSQFQDFLVELGSEELPPKALQKLAQAFHDNLVEQLNSAELSFESSQWFATPRRMAVKVTQLATVQPDKKIERLGPAVAAALDKAGNPTPAAMGFAKSCGVEFAQLETIETPKGARLGFNAVEAGAATSSLLANMVKHALAKLPIPKAMRWGHSNEEFIRPPHWLLMIFGEQVIEATILEQTADRNTFGHRFHAPESITVNSANQYEDLLSKSKVIVDFAKRKAMIVNQVQAIAAEKCANAVIEPGLLDEVTALVEWPVALIGKFDESFLQVPAEALIATMQGDQKYFHLVDSNGSLLPYFITVANIESSNPESVISGNERVIRPRLSDAKFFFDTDSKVSLDSYNEKLKAIVFQNKLGSLFDKTERVKQLAQAIAHKIGANETKVSRAAELCKSDLMTNMVYEFPDLQGIMGKHYAIKQSEDTEVAEALDEIYWPKFSGDQLPKTKTGLVLALADRIDTLVGIFGIGQAPTGAKDPFALRRASVGVLRLLIENKLSLSLEELIQFSINSFNNLIKTDGLMEQLLGFFNARMQALLSEQGFSTPVIQSVCSLNLTSPFDISRRIDAVNHFSNLDASEALAAANKRVKNILDKSDIELTGDVNSGLLEADAEKALAEALKQAKTQVDGLMQELNYKQALTNLASLREPIDVFFDNVMVNDERKDIKLNRYQILSQLNELFSQVADISLLQK